MRYLQEIRHKFNCNSVSSPNSPFSYFASCLEFDESGTSTAAPFGHFPPTTVLLQVHFPAIRPRPTSLSCRQPSPNTDHWPPPVLPFHLSSQNRQRPPLLTWAHSPIGSRCVSPQRQMQSASNAAAAATMTTLTMMMWTTTRYNYYCYCCCCCSCCSQCRFPPNSLNSAPSAVDQLEKRRVGRFRCRLI